MNKKRRIEFIVFLILSIIFFVIICVLISSNLKSQNVLVNKNSKGYVPLSKNDILISFRIDDITFSKQQKPMLETALSLARKYNITFDFGVIAKPFSESADPETFKIYQDNQDVFEIVAHGYTHALDTIFADESYGAHGEFKIISDFLTNKSIPINIQEQHIKKMKEIFEKNNLTMATKIFIVPYHSGDDNTIKLAEEYGYRLIVQVLSDPKNYSEKKYKQIIASEDIIDVAQDNQFDETDQITYDIELDKAILAGQKRIMIALHPINFEIAKNSGELIGEIVADNKGNPWIKFGMISNRFQ